MIKTMTTLCLVLFTTLLFSTTASAHSGMQASNTMHSLLHLLPSVGIFIAMMIAALYLFNRQPKAKKIRIKTKR